jgi:hypothetical protein
MLKKSTERILNIFPKLDMHDSTPLMRLRVVIAFPVTRDKKSNGDILYVSAPFGIHAQ